MNLSSEYEATNAYLEKIRENALSRRRKIILDLSELNEVSPAAALALVSEVDRCQKIRHSKKDVTGIYPESPSVEEALKSMGFFKLLGVRERPTEDKTKMSGRFIPFQTAKQSIGEEATELREALLGDEDEVRATARKNLFRALTEAMNNAVEHAYEFPKRQKWPWLKNQWWMLGYIDPENDQLKVMVIDQGIGIPASLPLKFGPEVVQALFSILGLEKKHDANMIAAAVEIQRTRTGRKNRGKGLKDLQKLVRMSDSGELTIMSASGKLVVDQDGNQTLERLEIPFCGTIIQWSVNLSSVLRSDVAP